MQEILNSILTLGKKCRCRVARVLLPCGLESILPELNAISLVNSPIQIDISISYIILCFCRNASSLPPVGKVVVGLLIDWQSGLRGTVQRHHRGPNFDQHHNLYKLALFERRAHPKTARTPELRSTSRRTRSTPCASSSRPSTAARGQAPRRCSPRSPKTCGTRTT